MIIHFTHTYKFPSDMQYFGSYHPSTPRILHCVRDTLFIFLVDSICYGNTLNLWKFLSEGAELKGMNRGSVTSFEEGNPLLKKAPFERSR